MEGQPSAHTLKLKTFMQLQGKIIAILDRREGEGSRGKWEAQSYVLETHEQYPHKIVFDVFGAERIQRFAIREGQEVSVSFDIDAREYNGKWYTDIRAYDVRLVDMSQPAVDNPQVVYANNVPAAEPQADPQDLPF